MNNFKDLNIKTTISVFVGDKIKVKSLLNKPITILDFKVCPSKANPGTEYVSAQIEKDGDKRVVFISSSTLINQINQIPKDKLPLLTTIKDSEGYYEFT